MPRILPIALLCACTFLSGPALADGPDLCLTNSNDPAVSFPDGSYDYVFVVQKLTGGYNLCAYSPTDLDMSAFTGASLADFNRDSWQDMAYGVQGSSGGEVQVFLNDKTGSGIVVLAMTLPTGVPHAPVLVGTLDLNGDGWPDIVTDNGSDGTTSVMLNDGTGQFPSLAQYAAGSDITSMDAVDLNGDGYPDIVTSDYTGNAIDVLINTGTGHFDPAVVIPVGAGPYTIQVKDLNQDSYPDIITENVHDQTVSVLMNNGDGTFATQIVYGVPHLSFLSMIDVNNDGHPDIVTDFTNGAWYALLNQGDGSFAPAAWVAMPGGSSGGADLSAGAPPSIGGVTTPISGNTFSSGTGKIKLPTSAIAASATATPPTPQASTPKAKTSSGSSSSASKASASGSSDAGGSSGGGAMGWLSLALFGTAGFLRRKKT